jgi:phage terminase small subunit
MQMTPKQLSFIHEYLVDKNATQAAIRAGYSAKTAAVIAIELLRKPNIREAIDEKLNKANEKCGLTHELVHQSLIRELKFDPSKLFDDNGNAKSIHEIDQDTRMALTGVETSELFGTKYKWTSPNVAREQAMKHLGMFEKDNEQAGKMTVTISKDDSGLV